MWLEFSLSALFTRKLYVVEDSHHSIVCVICDEVLDSFSNMSKKSDIASHLLPQFAMNCVLR
ncbi:MAG: hypothetical protein QOJ19_3808 [Acidimicrobiia bacterium]|nr:hypothetical protein [Acidimicrobiia bacterium]